MESPGPDLTASSRGAHETNMRNFNAMPNSRWVDHAGASRVTLPLFALLEQTNQHNAEAVSRIKAGEDPQDVFTVENPSPFDMLNDIFRAAGLELTLSLDGGGGLNASDSGQETRPINHLSDGERNALILAAQVVTSAPHTVLILDEPERHMHRAMSATLLLAMMGARPDCHFVVMTHDLDLAERIPDEQATKVVLAGCRWVDGAVESWTAYPITGADAIPEDARLAVLGGRKAIRFVEGTAGGLDDLTYRVLLPGATTTPVGGCSEVIRSTRGLRSADQLHWIDATGVVDNDRRSAEEITALNQDGVAVLGLSEVENLYYWPPIIAAIAADVAASRGEPAGDLESRATDEALASLAISNIQINIAGGVALAAVKDELAVLLPTKAELSEIHTFEPVVEVTFESELKRLADLVEARDLAEILRLYPVRESGLRARVAKALGFSNPATYESAVRNLWVRDPDLCAIARGLVGL
ncbi:MAG: transporter ATP-binding protein [Ilumatobacteraceae bacterium]|nr:transporter ATP-binding protein [Ilumatobacteraceae bacterium]